MTAKIQLDQSKIKNLPKIKVKDKVVIFDQCDTEQKIKTVLWLERRNFKGKDRICLTGAAYNRASIRDEFIMQKTDALGYHQINKNGEQTIKYSVSGCDIKSLYELIVY